jgi:hypothetical protein
MTYKHKNRYRLDESIQIVKNTKNHKNQGYKKGLSLTFKKEQKKIQKKRKEIRTRTQDV